MSRPAYVGHVVRSNKTGDTGLVIGETGSTVNVKLSGVVKTLRKKDVAIIR